MIIPLRQTPVKIPNHAIEKDAAHSNAQGRKLVYTRAIASPRNGPASYISAPRNVTVTPRDTVSR